MGFKDNERVMRMSDLLDFREIAVECNVSYDTVRRTIRKIKEDLSIEVQRKRNKKGTLSDCLSIEDVNKLKSHFESKKASTNLNVSKNIRHPLPQQKSLDIGVANAIGNKQLWIASHIRTAIL